MKTVSEIDPTLRMSKEDFLILFAHLPLLEDEKARLENDYYTMYTLFLDNDTEPTEAWIATRNIFIHKEQQIAGRKTGDIIGAAGKSSQTQTDI